MSSLTLLGDTSGSVVLDAPAVAGSTTLTLPTTSGTVLASGSTGVCRAWVKFNGTTTPPTINASYNVTSVTRASTGVFTVTFTNALPTANFVAVGTISVSGVGGDYPILQCGDGNTTTTALILTYNAGANQNWQFNNVAFFA